MLVRDLMTKDVAVTTRDTMLTHAATVMTHRAIGMLVVVDDQTGMQVLGVLSDSDIIGKVVAQRVVPGQVMVGDIMTPEVLTIPPTSTVSDAANIMRTKKLKRLPVIEGGRLVGIISSTDILRAILDVKKQLLNVALEF